MSIERLGPVDPMSVYNKNQKVSPIDSKSGKDSISVSDEAKIKAGMLKITEEVNAVSDLRSDRVAEVKEKLKNSSYIDDVIIDEVAEKILDSFNI